MMKILRALRDELARNKLSLSDILPVAGIDPGTLEDRYTDAAERGSVIAKTGTLIRTDGGASSLCGQMKKKSGGVVLFVIMNQRGNVLRFRQNQDTIVSAIQNSFGVLRRSIIARLSWPCDWLILNLKRLTRAVNTSRRISHL